MHVSLGHLLSIYLFKVLPHKGKKKTTIPAPLVQQLTDIVADKVEPLAQQSKVDDRLKLQAEKMTTLGNQVVAVTRAVTALDGSVDDGFQKMSAQLAALNQRVEQLAQSTPVRMHDTSC